MIAIVSVQELQNDYLMAALVSWRLPPSLVRKFFAYTPELGGLLGSSFGSLASLRNLKGEGWCGGNKVNYISRNWSIIILKYTVNKQTMVSTRLNIFQNTYVYTLTTISVLSKKLIVHQWEAILLPLLLLSSIVYLTEPIEWIPRKQGRGNRLCACLPAVCVSSCTFMLRGARSSRFFSASFDVNRLLWNDTSRVTDAPSDALFVLHTLFKLLFYCWSHRFSKLFHTQRTCGFYR